MVIVLQIDWCMNCAFRDKSMEIGMQLEQVLRSIFGYRSISKIIDDGIKFGISYMFLLNSYIVKKRKFHVPLCAE